jgi:hypothetical protein
MPHLNGGVVIVFDRDERDEDLARLSCKWCDQPAPGDSGRCKRHQAKKYATVELACEWEECPREGEPFTRHGSVRRARADRGDEHAFCSDRCEMLYLKRHHPGFSSPPPFDADFVRERSEDLGPQFEELKAELRLPLGVDEVAVATATSPSVIRSHAHELGGQVLLVDGAEMLAFPPDAAARNKRQVLANDHRARYLDPKFMAKQQRRTIALLKAKGLSHDQAEAAVKAATVERRKAIRGRGPKPASSPSTVNVARNGEVEQARQELEAEHRDGLRLKPPSARAARLRAAQNIAAREPQLLPAEYTRDGRLRAHYDDAAIALLAKAEKACKLA